MSTSASSSTDAGSTKHPAGSPAKDYPKYSLSELTPSDPQAYLSLFKFSRKIICPRTNLPVSFADIGDESGVPLLWMMPSGGSRWFAAAHDPLCRRYGIRMIVVDRPGIGATPMIPLQQRIQVTGKLVESVLEHLAVKPAHILAASAGVYYALHLLLHHPSIFQTGRDPPPTLYLVSPWSPLLPPDHPDYYSSYFSWIPTGLISTQHHTVPHLMKAGKGAMTLWDTGQKAWSSAKSWLAGGSTVQDSDAPDIIGERLSRSGSGGMDLVPDAPPVPEGEREEKLMEPESSGTIQEDPDEKQGRLWGDCPCCISCLVTEYFQAENFEGVGQDHLLCLNRGSSTGHEWFERTLGSLEDTLVRSRLQSEKKQPLVVHIWWGWQDGMVPRQGQVWLNKTFEVECPTVDVRIHDVPDGDHNDLLGRRDGIYEVYEMVSSQSST